MYIVRYEEGEDDCQCIGLMYIPKHIDCETFSHVKIEMAKIKERMKKGIKIRNIEVFTKIPKEIMGID